MTSYTELICSDCRLFHTNGDLPGHISNAERAAFIEAAGRSLADGVTMDIADQWSNGYDEFSVRQCYSCDTTDGGERYEVTYTVITPCGHVHDMELCRPLTAWSLVHDGQPAGSILWHVSPDVTACTVHILRGQFATKIMTTSANGTGYCTRSAALAIALSRLGDDMFLNGLGDARSLLSAAGYTRGEIL